MAAPIGNKYACGNPNSGRPPSYDIEKMAEDLLEWCLSPSSISLLGFANKHRMPPQNISEWAQKSNVFAEALMIAKSELGERRERLVSFGKLDRAAFSKAQHMYDPLLREFLHEELEFEYGLKSKVEDKKERGITINLIEKPWKDGNDRITE
jgi:hypothetical protein